MGDFGFGVPPKDDRPSPRFWKKLGLIIVAGLLMWAVAWGLAYLFGYTMTHLMRLGR